MCASFYEENIRKEKKSILKHIVKKIAQHLWLQPMIHLTSRACGINTLLIWTQLTAWIFPLNALDLQVPRTSNSNNTLFYINPPYIVLLLCDACEFKISNHPWRTCSSHYMPSEKWPLFANSLICMHKIIDAGWHGKSKMFQRFTKFAHGSTKHIFTRAIRDVWWQYKFECFNSMKYMAC